jgi:2-phosphoglycerate kinase
MRSTRLYKVRKTKRNLFYKDAISKLPDPRRSFKAPVILINGFSGVGKLTVAQQLR